jgi:hypothetical protein
MSNIEIENITAMKDRMFIAQYADKFERHLAALNDNTREIIRNNKQLNEFYDLFLDFILDSNQHLERKAAQERIQEVELS